MSMRSLETVILAEAKVAFNNRGLRLKDIREWSTGTVTPQADEVVTWLSVGVNCAIPKTLDKRKEITK